MSKVVIEVDSKWVRIVRSPLYWLIAAMQGVSLTFAPLFLYWSGKGQFPPGYEWIIVPSCFVIILLVGGFYLALGNAVVPELRKKQL